MWRDDGVAFTWEKIEGKGVPDPAKPGHAVAAVPEASLVQQPANSPSRPEFAQNGRTQVGESSAPDSGRVSFIPCPRHLATQEMRRAATDAMLEWMIEQWATVAEIDRSGRATRHVVLGQLNDHIGLRLQSFALPFGVEGNTRDQEMRSMAWNEKITYIPWPPELATAKLRKNLPDAYDEWKLRVWREVAKLDSSGHATKDVHFKVFPTSVRVSATPLAPDRDGHTEDRYRQTLRPLRTRSGIHQEDYSPANADDKSGLVRVPYPPEFAPRLARKTPAFAQWIDEQLEIVSNHRINDGPKRLVIPRKHDEALFINWRVRDEDVGARVLSPSMLPSRYHSTTNGSVHLQTFPSPNAERSTISPEGPPAKRVRINAPVFQQIRPPPALASASAPSAPEPESTSAILRGLETAMQSKLTAIDNWTNILADYPDRAEAIGKQVERTQGEIFQIRGQMRTEREKTRGLD